MTTEALVPAAGEPSVATGGAGTRAPWPGSGDRALLSVMLYSFARVSAVLAMRRQDYFGQANRAWLRLHEKGGKRHDVPAYHRAAAALDAYVEAAGLEEPTAALFQSVDPAGRRLTGRTLERRGSPGDGQASGSSGGAAALDVLPHVPGDGDYGVPVERGNAGGGGQSSRSRR